MKRGGAVPRALALLTLPFWVGNPYHLHVLIMAGIFTVLALSLNLLLGYTGQLSLGHAAFFGIGAYTSALLTVKLEWSFWLGLPPPRCRRRSPAGRSAVSPSSCAARTSCWSPSASPA